MCVRFYAQLYFGSAGGPTVAMRAKWVKPQHLGTVLCPSFAPGGGPVYQRTTPIPFWHSSGYHWKSSSLETLYIAHMYMYISKISIHKCLYMQRVKYALLPQCGRAQAILYVLWPHFRASYRRHTSASHNKHRKTSGSIMHRMRLYVRPNYLALMAHFWATIQATIAPAAAAAVGMEDDDDDDGDGIQISVSSGFFFGLHIKHAECFV